MITEENAGLENEHGENSGNEQQKPVSQYGYGTPPPGQRFSKDRQPDPNKQKQTKRRKKEARELLRDILNLKGIVLAEDSPTRLELERIFGKEKIRKMTALELAGARILQKAIMKGDEKALRELINQGYGLPKQIMEHSGVDGGPIETNNTTTVKRVIIQNPHITAENKK